MKQIALFAVSIVGTLTLTALLWFASLGSYTKAENWIPTAYQVKEAAAEAVSEPKALIVSGSSGMFGFDSETLAEMIGRPVVNLATHGGLPLEFHLAKALPHVKSGDVVIMPLELRYYSAERPPTEWQVTNLSSWAKDYVLSDPGRIYTFFRYASLVGTIDRLLNVGKSPDAVPAEDVRGALEANSKGFSKWNGYSYESMNRYGDFLIDAPGRFDKLQDYTDGRPGERPFEVLNEFKREVEARGGTIWLTWPPTMRNADFDLSNPVHLKKVQNLAAAAQNNGLQIHCEPTLFHYEQGMFLNTYYHLTAEGAVRRTVDFASCYENVEYTADTARMIYQARVSEGAGKSDYINAVVADFTNLQDALAKYKRDHGEYPKTSATWDGLYSAFGNSRPDWIPGLVPEYLTELPRDPRSNDNPREQYLYRSTGTNFKLIAHRPEDCREFVTQYPEMADPKRRCWAVGLYSSGAENW